MKSVRIVAALRCVLVPGLLAGVASAQFTWHVSATAAPGGDGSAAAPLASIQAVMLHPELEDGDTVLVGPGTYDGFLYRAEVRVESTHGPAVTFLRAATPSAAVVDSFMTNSALVGFTVRGGTAPGAQAVRFGSGLIEDCVLVGPGGSAPTQWGLIADCCQVRNCTITGFGIGVSWRSYACGPIVFDSIVFGNSLDLDWVEAHFTCYGTAPGTSLGTGCFSVTPGWIGGPTADLHLALGSPCIDAASPTAPLDPDGSRADMGAFAFEPFYSVPQVYCTAKTNSLGCVPQIGFSGIPSVSTPAPFIVRATNELNQRTGLLFWGYAPKNIPYQGGFLCVQAPTRRSQLLNSGGSSSGNDCSGTLQLDFNALLRSGVDPLATAGTELYSQFWSRDPGASFATNRTDALRFTVQP